MQVVTSGWETNFLCRGCGRCWRYELGYVSQVDPRTCPGCPEGAICTSRHESHHPAATTHRG